MANSFLERVLAAVAAVALLSGASNRISGTIPTGSGRMPIKYECDKLDVDYKTNQMHLRGNVKIVQGDISVAADEADARTTSQDYKTSHWLFTGTVHVRAESEGDLRADRATVEIANGELASAYVTGSPAQFQQTHSTAGRLAKGHAAAIDYQVAAATVTLTGDALLSDDQSGDDLHGPTITYNVRDMSVEADGAASGRAHMSITPGSAPRKKP
jgi:lipopolysaccharide transport protein LptA